MKRKSIAKKRRPKIVIIAGPNGAGKTTFAREFLLHEADCSDFINADLIAQGLAPFAPETAAIAAAKIMLRRMRENARKRNSFAFESTRQRLDFIRQFRPNSADRCGKGNIMKTRVISKDPDLRGPLPALRRAARAARKRSRNLGSPFYVMQNGRIVDLNQRPRKSKTRKSK